MIDLITLDEYKLAKGLSKNDQDDRLNMLIRNASSIIQAYLGRSFSDEDEDITEVFSLDYDARILYLDKYPVSDIVSITEIDPYGYDSSVHWPVPSATYFLDASLGRLIRTDGGYWPQGAGAVVVTYRAGYPVGIENVPAELKQATIDLVSYYKDEEYKPSKQTRGATITNAVGTGRSGDLSTAFPPHIQRILDLYK
jgi:hypothetical protein